MTTIYMLHATVGFVVGFLAATATIKSHVQSRDHVRNRIIGGGLVVLAILSVAVGIQQTRRNSETVQRQLTCEHRNVVAQNEAHGKVMGIMDRIIATPPTQRTQAQYDELTRAYADYMEVLRVQDQTQCDGGS